MAQDENQHEWQPLPCCSFGTTTHDHQAQVVERCTQHTTCQAKGIQTDIREHIAQDTSGHIVGIPQTCTYVNQWVTTWSVEDIDSQCRYRTYRYQRPLKHVLWQYGQAQYSHNQTTYNEQQPTPSSDILLEAKLLGVADSFHHHRQTDMEHTYTYCQYHLNIVAHHIALDHHILQRLRYPLRVVEVNTHECTKEESYYRSTHTQHSNDRTKTLKHSDIEFLLCNQQTDDNEQDTISTVAHTHREEQEEEWCQDRCRIKLTIVRPTIHTCQTLKELGELVIAQFDRRIVLCCRVFGLVIYLLLLEHSVQCSHLVNRAETLQNLQATICFRCSVECNSLPVNLLLQFVEFVLQCRDILFCPKFDTCILRYEQAIQALYILLQVSSRLLVQVLLLATFWCIIGIVYLYEVHHCSLLCYYDTPLLLEEFLWACEIAECITCFFELSNAFSRKVAPDSHLIDLFLGSSNTAFERSFLLQQLVRSTLRDKFASVVGFSQQFLQMCIICHACRFLSHMHYSHLAQLLEEGLILAMEHQEGVFLHLRNHACAPFLSNSSAIRASASRLDFTIFCDDLLRFSSSSIKRLILRIAS